MAGRRKTAQGTQATQQTQDKQTTQQAQEKQPAETIKQQLPILHWRMDYMRDPEDAVLKWDVSYEKWFKGYYGQLVKEVAQATGADPAQIVNKATRTPEQDRLLTEAAARRQMARLETFFSSAYMDALTALDPLQGAFNDPNDTDTGADAATYISVKEQAVLYFFATHDGIKPTEPTKLTAEQREELTDIYKKLDAYYAEHATGDPIQSPEILFAFIEQENPAPEKAESIVAFVQGINPTAHTMPNNALMNVLEYQPQIDAGPFDLVVSNAKGRRKEITAYTMLEFDPGETGIKITDAKLSEYERQVSDAVVSLWIEAVKRKLPAIFTPDMIYRAMPGGADKASPQQRGAITKAIEKFRRLHITVDATEEMRKRGVIGNDATYKIDNFYLSATHAEYKVKNGGQSVNAYRIDTEPIILTYCNLTKQLLTIPARYIAVEKVKNGRASGELLPMTSNRQAMTGYMLRRIAVMKNDKKNKVQTQSNVILFDTMFTVTGSQTTDRKQAMLNRNFCFEVLDYWQVAGFIKGYTKQEKSRSITGICIEI